MSLINIPAFSGLNILAAPQRIEDHQAVIAIGCDFRSLDLRAFKEDSDTGLGTTSMTQILANGGSIFQFDDTHWLGTAGDKSFARSPTFFSDATTGQRVFITDNAGPYPVGAEWEWNWVREATESDLVSSGYPQSYGLSSTAYRLGVPRPAAIGALKFTQQAGAVVTLSRATNTESTIETASDEDGPSASMDELILDVPGLTLGTYRITNRDGKTFSLRNTKLVSQAVRLRIDHSVDPQDIYFKKAGHGLKAGDQVVLYYNTDTDKTANTLAALNSGPNLTVGSSINTNSPPWWARLYTVVDGETYDTFRLRWGSDNETLARTSAAGADVNIPLRLALVTGEDTAIPVPAYEPTDDGSVFITSAHTIGNAGTIAKVTQLAIEYNILTAGGVVSTWANADTAGVVTDRSYVVTFVNGSGDESEPSAPTKTYTVAPGDPVTLLEIPITPAKYSGDFMDPVTDTQYVTLDKYPVIKKIRLYRTDATGTFRLVTTEVDADRTIDWTDATAPGFEFVDTYEDSELGEPLSTQGWQIPPRDLNGILISPGGSLVGYKGRSVYGSVPYAPYAFPLGNRVAFDYEVVGLVNTSSGIVVVTKGMPALIVGDDPSTWSVQKLEYPYGCVSRRSIVDLGEMAIYASADGLVGIVGANVEILTKDTIKREDWQSLYSPGNIFAAHAEGRYYGVTKVGNDYKAFMFDPRTRAFINLTVGTPYPVALYTRLDTDTLLILKSDGKVYAWNRGTNPSPYTWQSKYFQLTRPDILGCAQLIAPALVANFSLTFTLYGWDGQSEVEICRYTTVTGNVNPTNKIYLFDKNVNPFRLPVPNDRYTVYTVRLEGTLPIAQVSLASTIDELKTV